MNDIILFFSFPAIIFVIILFCIAFKPSCDISSKPNNTVQAWVCPKALPQLKKYNPIGSTNLWSNGNYHAYLLSREWNMIRIKTFSRDGFKCTKCGSILGLNAHHLTYENVYFEHENLEDLTTLCSLCHSAIDHEPILQTWS